MDENAMWNRMLEITSSSWNKTKLLKRKTISEAVGLFLGPFQWTSEQKKPVQH